MSDLDDRERALCANSVRMMELFVSYRDGYVAGYIAASLRSTQDHDARVIPDGLWDAAREFAINRLSGRTRTIHAPDRA